MEHDLNDFFQDITKKGVSESIFYAIRNTKENLDCAKKWNKIFKFAEAKSEEGIKNLINLYVDLDCAKREIAKALEHLIGYLKESGLEEITHSWSDEGGQSE